jgi:hypothetical protein
MTKHMPTYLAGALAVVVTGTLVYSNLERSASKTEPKKIEWCNADRRERSQDTIYSDYARKYEIVESPLGKENFVKKLFLENGGNIEKPRIMLPCGL